MGCHFPYSISTQGSNWHLLYLLRWQVDSLPLRHLGSTMKIVALLIFLWLNLISTLNTHTTRCRSNISASSVQGLHSPIKVFFPSSFLALLAPSPFFGVCVCVCVCVCLCVSVCVSLLNLLQYCFCFMFWFFGPEACGILVSLSRDQTYNPFIGRRSLNHWTAREVPWCVCVCVCF